MRTTAVFIFIYLFRNANIDFQNWYWLAKETFYLLLSIWILLAINTDVINTFRTLVPEDEE